MDAGKLFRENLGVVDRAIVRVCHRAGLQGADAEDFASDAKLALMENDYEILRPYRGECGLETFLTVVIQNLLSDSRDRTLGRFRPSAEAKRLGEAAVLLERLVVRDGRPLEEVLPIVRLTRAEAVATLDRLPARAIRARVVDMDIVDPESYASGERADERVLTSEAERIASETNRVVRETLATMSLEDRTILRLHYASNMTVADISRILRLPQRPLYRRLEASVAQLRRALTKAGLDASSVADLPFELDFGWEATS
ncbi:MAG TPA: sigma-70 family RNA polymerase sigma factor [Thermoanaerobaculia bacterium]|nr:sigma-70 family RNA polymerase sigma factor [Thermoanaerobaculia bacterium]